jgi:hypothetical protein
MVSQSILRKKRLQRILLYNVYEIQLYVQQFIFTGPYRIPIKGTVSRDFRPSVFSSNNPPRALIHGLKPIRKWLRIRRENRVGNRQNLMTPRDQTFWSEFPFNIYVSQ